MIRLIVGLGNPGTEYEDTRHNAGFWWVDEAASCLRASLSLDKAYYGLAARVNAPMAVAPGVAGPVWLLQPQTYMNLSGKSVGALARFFKIPPEDILVVHDELDLLPGQMKLKQGGGSAGHNGLKDITAQLGSPNYWRLRLGIGHPGDRAEVAGYVLRKPPASERELVRGCVDRSMQALGALLSGDMDKASRLIHAKPPTSPNVKASPAGAARPAAASAQPPLPRPAAAESGPTTTPASPSPSD